MLKLQPYNLGNTSEPHWEGAGLANHTLILLQRRASRNAQSSLAEVKEKRKQKEKKGKGEGGNKDGRKGRKIE